jgi:hypothetical protein
MTRTLKFSAGEIIPRIRGHLMKNEFLANNYIIKTPGDAKWVGIGDYYIARNWAEHDHLLSDPNRLYLNICLLLVGWRCTNVNFVD